jgi:hypothetical protein
LAVLRVSLWAWGKHLFSVVRQLDFAVNYYNKPPQIVTINHFVACNPGAFICSFIVSKHVQQARSDVACNLAFAAQRNFHF